MSDRITLVNDECFEYLPQIESGTVSVFFLDLPYGCTDNHWDNQIDLERLWCEMLRCGKKDCVYVFTANFKFANEIYNSKPLLFRYDCVLRKNTSTSPHYAAFRHMPAHELLLVFYDKKPKWRRDSFHVWNDNVTRGNVYTPKLPTTMLDVNIYEARYLHHCRKSVRMIVDLLKYWCDGDDLVVDPTMGSGASMEAVKQLGLRGIGIEKDVDFYETAVDRIK